MAACKKEAKVAACNYGSSHSYGVNSRSPEYRLTRLRASVIGGNESAESDVEGEKSMREKDVSV